MNHCGEKEYHPYLKGMQNILSVIRYQYAYAILVEKDKQKAEEILKRFEKVAKNYPQPIEVESERELLEYCHMSKDKTKNMLKI